jgi:hypothetical protein
MFGGCKLSEILPVKTFCHLFECSRHAWLTSAILTISENIIRQQIRTPPLHSYFADRRQNSFSISRIFLVSSGRVIPIQALSPYIKFADRRQNRPADWGSVAVVLFDKYYLYLILRNYPSSPFSIHLFPLTISTSLILILPSESFFSFLLLIHPREYT